MEPSNSNTTPSYPNTPVVVAAKSPPRKKKVLLAALAVFTLISGVITAVVLVQRQSRLRTYAWNCSAYNFKVSQSGEVTVENKSSISEPAQTASVTINGSPAGILNVPALASGASATLGTVTVPSNGAFTWSVVGTTDCQDTGTYLGTVPPAQVCPDNTELLFSESKTLSVGTSVGHGGQVTSMNGPWVVDNQNDTLLARSGSRITVTFPNSVLLDTALIFDNDPKSGENPWSINGVSLPTTPQGTWGPPFKLNLNASEMVFNNGGDSPHFNVCIGKASTPSSTPTPTTQPGISPSPSPTTQPGISPSPSPTQAPGISPSPSPTEPPTGGDDPSPTPVPPTPTNKPGPSSTPGPTGVPNPSATPIVPHSSPTPPTQLAESGIATPTWILSLGGLLLLGVGALLLVL